MKRPKAGDPKIALAYRRASKDEQALSPEAQANTIQTYAQQHGIVIVAWFDDQGVSGGSDIDDRPGLTKAIGSLVPMNAGVFFISRRDRLARDSYIAITITRSIEQRGARVISADGFGNGVTPADAFMRSVLDAASEYERSLIRQRTKDALAAKKRKGERAGGLPWGFTVDKDGKKLIPEPHEQAATRRAGALRATGLSLRDIERAMKREGYTARTGLPLGKTQIHLILKGGK